MLQDGFGGASRFISKNFHLHSMSDQATDLGELLEKALNANDPVSEIVEYFQIETASLFNTIEDKELRSKVMKRFIESYSEKESV